MFVTMQVPESFESWLVSALTAIVGYVWFDNKKDVEKLSEDIKDLQTGLSAHRENAAEKFVTRAEVKGDLAEIKQLVRDISLKLDGKADK